MSSRIDTCNDEDVPKPATGKTPVRTLRLGDEKWLPAVAKAEAEGRTLSSVLEAAIDAYNAQPLEEPRRFTLANWPEAAQWARLRSGALRVLRDDLAPSTGPLPAEWLAVAAWLASTRHPADVAQQNRILTGHIVGRAVDEPREAHWRQVNRDSRRLSADVQQIVDRHLPLSAGE